MVKKVYKFVSKRFCHPKFKSKQFLCQIFYIDDFHLVETKSSIKKKNNQKQQYMLLEPFSRGQKFIQKIQGYPPATRVEYRDLARAGPRYHLLSRNLDLLYVIKIY